MIHDGHMIIGDQCGPNFLIFDLRLREKPGKYLNQETTWPGIEPGPAAWEITMLPLDHSGSSKTVLFLISNYEGAKGDWDFRISDLVKTLTKLILNPCGKFRWSPEGPVSQIHSPHLLVGAPGIFSDLLRFIEMLKREWGAERNGKLPYLFILSKTAT